ncbi:MAG: hypothetical protein WCV00_07170 [Verrucomicrobiia bacterium]
MARRHRLLRVEAVEAEDNGAKLEGALAGDEEVGGDAVEIAKAACGTGPGPSEM